MAILYSQADLLAQLEATVESTLYAGLAHDSVFTDLPDEERSENSQNWLSWACGQRTLKTVNCKVPVDILPSGLEGELTDVKVFARGPDDKVYDKNSLYRKRVARGNCVLELRDQRDHSTKTDCVIFALKKFTGGLGDDDDREIGDGFKYEKYFTQPIENAELVICTRKMNGEAAHFAVRWIENDFYIIAGSKNVHLLFRTREQIELYADSRFQVARDVARCCFDEFQAMNEELRWKLFSFFHHTKYTAVLEILLPHYQHVENLSNYASPALYFISWSKTDFDEGYEEEICVPPDLGQKVAAAFGLRTTGFESIPHKNLKSKLMQIRSAHGTEGQVLYFVNKDHKVIGLLKKKTIWYIILRAIREKAKNGASKLRRNESSQFELADTQNRTRKRIREIKGWLGLDEKATAEWEDLATGFLKWLAYMLKTKGVKSEDLFSLYPVVWTSFLTSTGRTDKIGVTSCSLLDDPDEPHPEAAPEGGSVDKDVDDEPDS